MCGRARALFVAVLTVAVTTLWVTGEPHASDEPPDDRERTEYGQREELRVAVAQFEVRERYAHSLEAFRGDVQEVVRAAAEAGAHLVVFPEYLNVFPALYGQDELLAALEGPEQDRSRLEPRVRAAAGAQEPRDDYHKFTELLQEHAGVLTPRELFYAAAPEVSRLMDETYGEAAARFDITVVAGSYFAQDGASGESGRLRNRAVVYGPEGNRIHEQDKAYLTPFEENLLGLESADPAEADTFQVEGWSIGLTICRDTYFEVWDDVLGDQDVWIDLRGEGTEYDQSVKERLERAIPERLRSTGVPYGVTVFLTGEFLGLYWEGRSNVVEHSDLGIEAIEEADSSAGEDVFITELTPR